MNKVLYCIQETDLQQIYWNIFIQIKCFLPQNSHTYFFQNRQLSLSPVQNIFRFLSHFICKPKQYYPELAPPPPKSFGSCQKPNVSLKTDIFLSLGLFKSKGHRSSITGYHKSQFSNCFSKGSFSVNTCITLSIVVQVTSLKGLSEFWLCSIVNWSRYIIITLHAFASVCSSVLICICMLVSVNHSRHSLLSLRLLTFYLEQFIKI